MLSEHAGEPTIGDLTHARAHELYGRHERERDERGPQKAVAERGTRLGVRGDARRVIVRCSCDEPRAQRPQRADDRVAALGVRACRAVLLRRAHSARHGPTVRLAVGRFLRRVVGCGFGHWIVAIKTVWRFGSIEKCAPSIAGGLKPAPTC